MTLQRGRVYAAILDEQVGEKYYLVVSNNARNQQLGTALVARLTTSRKPELSSIVELPQGEPFIGRVLCDDLTTVWDDEIRRDLGAMSPLTMRRVGEGLKAALALT